MVRGEEAMMIILTPCTHNDRNSLANTPTATYMKRINEIR